MIDIPAESLTPNHIFLSDLTLIAVTTSTNYILFADNEASTGDSYISDILIHIHSPSFFISRSTDYMRHQLPPSAPDRN